LCAEREREGDERRDDRSAEEVEPSLAIQDFDDTALAKRPSRFATR
jgi:hypothetical protein